MKDKYKIKQEVLKEIFEKMNIESQYEDSLIGLSNWILGISLGLFTLMVLRINANNVNDLLYYYHKALICLTMINLLFSGFTRHALYVQKLRIAIITAEISHLILLENFKDHEFKVKISELSLSRINEHKNTRQMHKWLNINTYSIALILLLFGTYVLLK